MARPMPLLAPVTRMVLAMLSSHPLALDGLINTDERRGEALARSLDRAAKHPHVAVTVFQDSDDLQLHPLGEIIGLCLEVSRSEQEADLSLAAILLCQATGPGSTGLRHVLQPHVGRNALFTE